LSLCDITQKVMNKFGYFLQIRMGREKSLQ